MSCRGGIYEELQPVRSGRVRARASSPWRSWPSLTITLPPLSHPPVTGALRMSLGASFLEQVNRAFDRAAGFTDHDPTLLANIKASKNLFYTSFPIKR